MEKSTIAILILFIVAVVLVYGKIAISAVLMLAAGAMVLTGILDFPAAFSAFASTTVWFLIALMVVGTAFEKYDILRPICNWIRKYAEKKEKTFIELIYVLSAVFSLFVNGIIVIYLVTSVIDKIVVCTKGRITRKRTYYPVALGSALGSLCSSVGSSSMMNVSAQLQASEFGRGFHLMEPFKVGFPVLLGGFLIIATFGYGLEKRVFCYADPVPEPRVEYRAEGNRQIGKKLLVCVALGILMLLAATEWMNIGLASVGMIFLLVITGCLSEEEALRGINWKVVFCVVGSLGLGKGVSESGAGMLLAKTILSHCGGLADSAFAMCAICLFLCVLLSNFMANNSAAAIMTPIAFNIAREMGQELLPFAMACAIGVNLAIATPICRETVTMVLGAGYNARNLGIVGGIMNAALFLVAVAALYVVYF